ncbi:PfkB family carbohydrate kinase [Timonella sp. A28]|uniref:PfkB family carbohydrate kinase n=1 Tax=Timonella sp. A28 TaxID=3442640 RepID=UPI003EBEDEBF
MTATPPATPHGVFIGLTVLDVLNRVNKPPHQNEKITAHQQDIAAGGPAANAALTYAALGGHATLITLLGDSPASQIARADLEHYGVTIIDCAPTGTGIGISAITVLETNGDRSVISPDGGTFNTWEITDTLRTTITDALQNTTVALADGHHPQLLEEVLDYLPANTPLVIDAGRWKPQFEWLMPKATHIVASADFHDPLGFMDNAFTRSSERVEHTVVQTHGAHPIRWVHGQQHGIVTAPSVHARDTLGAGDVFHGAYCYFLTAGKWQIPQVIEQAAHVAALKVSTVGPRAWIAQLSHINPDNPYIYVP